MSEVHYHENCVGDISVILDLRRYTDLAEIAGQLIRHSGRKNSEKLLNCLLIQIKDLFAAGNVGTHMEGRRRMNLKQMNTAKEALAEWLAHPQELGKKPAKIECAGEFDLHDLHYYIFKYKKTVFGKWLLGICGGYEGVGLEHCGHVYSEMQEYAEATAQDDAIKMVEMIRAYWMERAKRVEERKENSGNFVNFVLLKENMWDKEEFLRLLAEEWQIRDDSKDDAEDGADSEENAEPGNQEEDVVAVLSYHGYMISAALMPAPVPDGEAEYNAQSNYMWKDAAEVTKQHRAHLVIAVMGRGGSAAEAGELLVKTAAACCRQKNVLGVYANKTVYQPEFYLDFAAMMKEGMFPVFNLVWFGLYGSEKGLCAYTCGLNSLGYDELEILDSSAGPQELRRILTGIALYVINGNVTLRDGETIGFTAEQKLPITKSRGIAVEGESLKIAY